MSANENNYYDFLDQKYVKLPMFMSINQKKNIKC